MYSHLDVYCDTCCSLPGEFCTAKWVVTDTGFPFAEAADTHSVRVNRSKAAAAFIQLLLPVNLVPEDPKCPGCKGTYEEHMLNDCFESFGRPVPPEMPE